MVESITVLKLWKLPTTTKANFKNYMKQNLEAKWNQTQIMEIVKFWRLQMNIKRIQDLAFTGSVLS